MISRTVDGLGRRVCGECNHIEWNNPIPVVAALVKYNNKYIIARNTQWDPGVFSLIAGYLESGEEIEKGVIREVREELNLDGKITNFLGYYSFLDKNQIILAFEVEATGNLEKNHELAEIIELSSSELSVYDFSYFNITEKIINVWSKLNLQSA